MKGWQYKFFKLKPYSYQEENEREFRQLGLDGWELIATFSTVSGTRVNNTAIFKKPLSDVKRSLEEKKELKKDEPVKTESAPTAVKTEPTLTVPFQGESVQAEPTPKEPDLAESAIIEPSSAEPVQMESTQMRLKFGTLEWYQKMADWLNNDQEWMKAALTTSFMYVYSDVVGPDGQPRAFLMKFDNGKGTVSEAKAADLSNKETEFGSTATYAMHAGIARGEINPQKAKLKLNMMKAMRNQKALGRQSEAMKAISKETEF